MRVAYFVAANLIAAGFFFAGCGRNKPAAKNDETVIRNLQRAWNAESNTAVKYDLYAAKSAEAGYRGVATLFRAASHSESILAVNQTKIPRTFLVCPGRGCTTRVKVASCMLCGSGGEASEVFG